MYDYNAIFEMHLAAINEQTAASEAFRKRVSPVQWIREFRVVGMHTSRQTGKTEFALKCLGVNPSVLLLVRTDSDKKLLIQDAPKIIERPLTAEEITRIVTPDMIISAHKHGLFYNSIPAFTTLIVDESWYIYKNSINRNTVYRWVADREIVNPLIVQLN